MYRRQDEQDLLAHFLLWHAVLNGGKVVELKLHFPHVARRSLIQLHKSYVSMLWGTRVLCTRSSSPLALTETFGMEPFLCSTRIASLLGVDVIR